MASGTIDTSMQIGRRREREWEAGGKQQHGKGEGVGEQGQIAL